MLKLNNMLENVYKQGAVSSRGVQILSGMEMAPRVLQIITVLIVYIFQLFSTRQIPV